MNLKSPPLTELLFDRNAIAQAVTQISEAIIKDFPFSENHPEQEKIALIGIQVKGVILAQRLLESIQNKTGGQSEDIRVHRSVLQSSTPSLVTGNEMPA